MLASCACAPHFNREPTNDRDTAANEDAKGLLSLINEFINVVAKNGEEEVDNLQDVLRELSPMLDEKSIDASEQEKSPSKTKNKRTASQAQLPPLRSS